MGALAKGLSQILATENSTISSLEKAYMKNGRTNTYIALEELDFIWCEKEIKNFRSMWKAGYDIWKIAEKLGRSVHDVFMLAYDQHLKGKIDTRKGAIFGWQPNSRELTR